jgi:hypothetical protein
MRGAENQRRPEADRESKTPEAGASGDQKRERPAHRVARVCKAREAAAVQEDAATTEGSISMNPHSVLDEAKATIGERGRDYGEVEMNFDRIATLFNMTTASPAKMDQYDVAMLMVCLKLSRIRQSPDKRDSYVDLINYAAFACELAGAK